ncbi:CbtA family protein [Haloplanus salinus]|uniref:CbtA family protein n=1 Tax=Haloplanus salinus TaxID=1126245 RepID=UPI001FE4AD32|nr:CbtA family protein [Haloplanus salinus]
MGDLLGGAVFGVAFYLLEPVVPGSGATKSYVLGAADIVTVSGVPWLVLPPAPPGVGGSLPTATRLALYGASMAAGGLTRLLSGGIYDRVRASNGRVIATVAALVPHRSRRSWRSRHRRTPLGGRSRRRSVALDVLDPGA